ncbi:short-chain dehydrogenase [Thermobispora bispora]|jgi:decaprenylphospho-beta-D-erythro-pentofuranosid-2-ulose 2-reductase|uniref:Short-chain dehydrogenase/reductase SDR n=1 Tax=Thermobispora bispora (strain ATCC 19993 / DSM 43833 / CBS 139.67 / JCM 10125 / KCTC 9307 / NBRC 14880 / R51) TaxID=469371 RepID=D6Y6G5_THEBD|nr:decaprenylphospho-beta-D-erythro-pentofuranosid-2-ulose 2-reductase [Thermobispora bispora]MBO2472876.1 decaprenylphospho-beta-D-erythro-pentofuranosid-2-ulose 2-reductase [Actinomycetales bacterium]MDI9580450.1 decaprenylphospho-beta-D-erythro-pentofuranosid-2-ulose 2-reductase [Thermobispora sp.]ADG87537.1 short-chain dehydrogenase/reductase SDR [Thermobispora bispora DSM 43833]MBX6168291.1 decaprenylphospho-beta-D-erythro-pentofuranosid-2-ulose 2-reductase [Thermobispora bispora]QSI47467
MRNALGSVDSVLLLGGRSEIGLAIVERLVRNGARKVMLAARGGTAPAERLRALGAEVHVAEFDAARPETHPALIDEAVARLGDLDVVIPAFGVLGDQARYEEDPVAAARDVAVNFGGHVSVGLAAARRLREQGHGTLVVLSSVAGVRVRKANFVYGSAKAGLDGFARGLADSLHGTGVRVLIVRPGFVIGRMTQGMTPAPFSVTVDTVADAVVGAIASGRRTVWVPAVLGPIFTVMRHLPGWAWRRLPR